MFIKSDGNYSTVYLKKGDELRKKMIRNTLKSLENELINMEKIVRCHKSYIVNLNKVKQVTGNARGYNFILEGLEMTIPVSRNFPKSYFKEINIQA